MNLHQCVPRDLSSNNSNFIENKNMDHDSENDWDLPFGTEDESDLDPLKKIELIDLPFLNTP